MNFVTAKGKGVYVGDTLTLFNGDKLWWGEGDEKIYVDDETFPSHFGTGTEDYYCYAWGRHETFAGPFNAQPDGTGNNSPGFTVNTPGSGVSTVFPSRGRYGSTWSSGPGPPR